MLILSSDYTLNLGLGWRAFSVALIVCCKNLGVYSDRGLSPRHVLGLDVSHILTPCLGSPSSPVAHFLFLRNPELGLSFDYVLALPESCLVWAGVNRDSPSEQE